MSISIYCGCLNDYDDYDDNERYNFATWSD